MENIKLIFDIRGALRRYTVKNYFIDDEGFYNFTDLIDGKKRRLHKKFLAGQEGGLE